MPLRASFLGLPFLEVLLYPHASVFVSAAPSPYVSVSVPVFACESGLGCVCLPGICWFNSKSLSFKSKTRKTLRFMRVKQQFGPLQNLKGNILECNYINMYALPRFLFRQVLALKFALITQIYMAFVASAPKLRCPIPSTHLFPDKCPISGSLNRSQFVLPPLHLYLHLIFACLFAFLCSAQNPLCGVFVLSE